MPEMICLICEGPTTGAHLGVEACRACAAFFRRAIARKKPYVCRTGNEDCTVVQDKEVGKERETGTPSGGCRKCRYSKCLRFGMRIRDASEKGESPDSIPTTSLSAALPSLVSPVPIINPVQISNEPADIPLLTRIKEQFHVMELVRRTSEMASRNYHGWDRDLDPRLIIQTNDEMPWIPSTHASMNEFMKTAVLASSHFAGITFDLFNTLTEDDKWIVLKNFFNYYFVYDTRGRCIEHHVDPDRYVLLSCASYFDVERMELFFGELPPEQRENAKKLSNIIRDHVKDTNKIVLPLLTKLDLTEMEKASFVGLMMWSTYFLEGSPLIQTIAIEYRKIIYRELHLYYTKDLKIENYAERIGNMNMMLICLQEFARQVQQLFEIFRLVDIFKDDYYVYQMGKR